RTNQFNLNTQRRSEKELMALGQDNFELWLVKASDRFGQYGWVGLVIFEVTENTLNVDSFILSCRVLARKVEHAIFAALKQQVKGVGSLSCDFIASAKNQPIKRFLDEMNWDREVEKDQQIHLEMAIANIPPMDESLIFEQLRQFPVVTEKAEPVHNVDKIVDKSVERRNTSKPKQPALQYELSNESAFHHRPYYQALFASNADALQVLPYQEIANRDVENEYVAAQTELEQAQVELWQDLLKVSNIGVLDYFFQLGGHSLLATRLLSGAYQNHQVKITLKDFFDNATIRQFCGLIEQQQPDFEVIDKVPKQAHYELSYAQRRLWAVQQLDPNSFAYNTPNNYHIEGQLSVEHMRQAFYSVFEKHQSLRTCFDLIDGQPRQFIVEDVSEAFEFVSLQVLQVDDFKAYLSQLGEQVFDLVKGPLVNVMLIQLGRNSHVLHVNMHHIISDGWSMELLEDEVLAVYGQLQANNPDYKPQPLALQYTDYAVWHNNKVSGKVNGGQLKQYWLNKLGGELPDLAYPLDKKRPLVQTHVGRVKSFEFSTEFSAGLNQLASQLKLSHFAVLNALVKLYLYKMTGQTDLIVGAPVAGRSHPDCQ
ncbi:MAG: condensation domain-containing protein, partial [Psychrosphaera sp.]|nr:condensation domain-containing protein [Psychrosphaera sp.]